MSQKNSKVTSMVQQIVSALALMCQDVEQKNLIGPVLHRCVIGVSTQQSIWRLRFRYDDNVIDGPLPFGVRLE